MPLFNLPAIGNINVGSNPYIDLTQVDAQATQLTFVPGGSSGAGSISGTTDPPLLGGNPVSNGLGYGWSTGDSYTESSGIKPFYLENNYLFVRQFVQVPFDSPINFGVCLASSENNEFSDPKSWAILKPGGVYEVNIPSRNSVWITSFGIYESGTTGIPVFYECQVAPIVTP